MKLAVHVMVLLLVMAAQTVNGQKAITSPASCGVQGRYDYRDPSPGWPGIKVVTNAERLLLAT